MSASPNQIRGMTLKSVLPASGAMIPIIITSDTSGTNYNYDLGAAFASIGVVGGALVAVNNLSDLVSASAARTNLELGSAATQASTVFLASASNLSDLANASTARSNLELGTVAILASDTDTGLAANSDSRVATQKAVKAAIGATASLVLGQTPTLNGLVLGGGVVWESAYTFRVAAASYYINGTLYTSIEQTITLTAADAALDRIDVIALNTSGTVVKITGTAASTPSEPDFDPTTQLKLTFVQVAAASSAPAGLTVENIYLENTEWTSSTSGTGWTVASTVNPYAGTKDIEGTNVAAAAYVQLQRGSSTALDTFTSLNMFIRSKATWAVGRFLRAQFFLNGVAKGTAVTINTGYWGFDSSITSGYQLNSIPIGNFVVPAGTLVNQLRITDVGGAIGFYIDNITMQSTTTAVGGGGGTGITQTQADARYFQRANNLSEGVAATMRTSLGLGSIATFAEGTTAEFRANTSGKALSTDKVWAAAGYVALTDAATVAVDMSAGFNFSLTLGGNRTLGAPSNTKNGQKGSIVITQDGTGTRTLAYHANWKFAGGTDPTLSTAAGTIDVLFYEIVSSTFIIASLGLAFA